MQEKKVSVLNDSNEKLVGLETKPSVEKEKYPAVILVHGFGATKEESGMFDELAEKLSEAGFLVYRFDFSGRGESEGDYSEISLSKLKSDLSKILDFVRTQEIVDNSRIGILGQSLGTPTIVTLEPKVKCLVMTSSTSNPKEILKELFGEGYNPDGISTRMTSEGELVKIKPQFWKDFENHDLLESIKKINCPILFIHGSEDDKVPLSEVEAYFNNANEPKEIKVIQGAEHGFRPNRDKMYEIAVDWFKKFL
ncbi:alpha/beta fold hydrolase [Candidatus Woesearchaeota archaeon]|nr:alpha/beta fold hydrolase [Candidatus Woesearchaeota archaeon]